MVFSISVVASLPGLETVTVEAKPLQADGRGWRCWRFASKNQKLPWKNGSENIYPLVDHHVPQ